MNSCVACNRRDEEEDMVACDTCDEWQHYSCAGVDSSIKDKSWVCGKCTMEKKGSKAPSCEDRVERAGVSGMEERLRVGDTRSTKITVKEQPGERVIKDDQPRRASVRKTAAEDEMLMVKGELERKAAGDTRSMRSGAMRHKLEGDTRSTLSCAAKRLEVVEDRTVRGSAVERKRAEDTRSRCSSVVKRPNVFEDRSVRGGVAVRKRVDDTRSAGSSAAEWQDTDDERSFVSGAVRGRREADMRSKCSSISERVGDDEGDEEIQEQLLRNEIALLRLQLSKRLRTEKEKQEKKLKEQRDKRIKEKVSDNESVSSITTEDKVEDWLRSANAKGYTVVKNVSVEEPTNKQIAARHVIGKDLPIYAGDPKTWAIWYSNYERTTKTCGFTTDENLIRLQRCLKGPALELVEGRLLLPENVPSAIELLKKRFGRPDALIRSLIEKVRMTPSPRRDDLQSFIRFGSVVDSLVQHIEAAKMANHLSNPTLLHDLVHKLPTDYQIKWAEYKLMKRREADIGMFGRYMNHLLDLAFDVVEDRPAVSRGHVNVHHNNTSIMPRKTCVVCNGGGHGVSNCATFKALTGKERWTRVNNLSLCRTCLNRHGSYPCKSFTGCEVTNCRLRHHTLLHTTTNTDAKQITERETKGNSGYCGSHKKIGSTSTSLFRIVPVTLERNGLLVEIYALLDEGSDLTLLDEEIAKQLEINEPQEELKMMWTGQVARTEKHSMKVNDLTIHGQLNHRYQVKGVRTVASLQLQEQSLCYQELVSKYPHLSGLPITDYNKIVPRMLIGLDNVNLIVPVKVREGAWNEPIASKCKLGWGIYGRTNTSTVAGIVGYHTEATSDNLTQLVREFIIHDKLNISIPTIPIESDENKRARALLDSTTKRIGRRFETGLLWKTDVHKFPPSYDMAYKRFLALERRLQKDQGLYGKVRCLLREYEEKGYAHLATANELRDTKPEECWYLPLGVVVNPRKPNKVRIIWDAAATSQGVSLNSALLKGPDLLNSLIGVLYNFRKYMYALTGDIREMFHRLVIRPADRQYQRFLWRDDATQTIKVYVLDVAMFGAACSPTSAQYVKNCNAREVGENSRRALNAILDYHYVDDYLDSFPTVKEAIEVGKEVKRIHAEGGFEIRNFLSNDKEIVNEVSQESTDVEKIIEVDKSVESVLGMKWKPEKDVLTYAFAEKPEMAITLMKTHIPTKREVLRTVMSLFDPLGLLSFFLIHGRILLQDIWAAGTDWDEPIEEPQRQHWRRWVEMLPLLPAVKIPRCYFREGNYETYNHLEIHIFVDASKSAYAAVAYFRVVMDDEPAVALIAAKAKVAPLKLMSIPRLELQGAVLGVRLLNSIEENHRLKVKRRVIWTDSEIVLAWLRADHRRYQQFVGFRVAEILSSTDVSEWRKVESKLNVADLATKWSKEPCFDEKSTWFQGPGFLKQAEECWPTQKREAYTTETELRAVNVHVRMQQMVAAERFSRWEKLEGCIARIHQFISILKRKRQGERISDKAVTQEQYAKAEYYISFMGPARTLCRRDKTNKQLKERRKVK